MGVLFPHLPFGTPPPLGIEFAPPKMRDLLFQKGANRAFLKTPLEKSLSLALTYSSGEQYKLNVARGARRATRRARRPCLLNVSFGLRGREARRGVQAAVTPPVNAWVSGALDRLRKRNVVLGGAPCQMFIGLTLSFGCRTRKHPFSGEARTKSYVTSLKRGADKVMRQMRASGVISWKERTKPLPPIRPAYRRRRAVPHRHRPRPLHRR